PRGGVHGGRAARPRHRELRAEPGAQPGQRERPDDARPTSRGVAAPRGATGESARDGPLYPLDLAEVDEVVRGHQPRELPHALLATLGVEPDALPARLDRKSTRLNSSHVKISYAVFCLKKKK